MSSKKRNTKKEKEEALHQQEEPETFDLLGGEEPDASAETTAEMEGLDYPSPSKLADRLTAIEKECDEYRGQAARAQAQIENIRRRASLDLERAHKYANEKLLNELLPVLDSLRRGLEGEEPTDPTVKNMRCGMQLTLEMFLKVLNRFGVKLIEPAQGEAFDPAVHEAMSTAKDKRYKPHTIIQLLEPGYQLHDRVIRAARVIVAA